MARQNTLKHRAYKTPYDEQAWEHPDATTNYEGGLAFQMDPETELYTRVASCLFQEPKFYKEESNGKIIAQNQDDILLKLARSVAMQNPNFVLQLAAYARNELYLRTIPVILWTEVAMTRKKLDNRAVRLYGPSILKRADEPAEAIAYYLACNGSFVGSGGRFPALARKGVILSHAIQKGIEDAIFANYDRYQIAKYDRKNASVKWRDVINLVHPNPEDKRLADVKNKYNTYAKEEWARIFHDVLAGTLAAAETWEDTLMTWKEKGHTSKKEAWETIIPKMPYMALLRNLRNFAKEEISETAMGAVIQKLTNSEEIKRSKQFPYRFYSAYKALEGAEVGSRIPALQAAIEDAMDSSVKWNLPRWPGLTYFAADFSGSMSGAAVSQYSDIDRKEIACVMMCLSNALCEKSICSVFADRHKIVQVHERDGLLSNVQRILRTEVGSATDAYLAVAYLINNNIKVDRMVLFSDMQCYNTADKMADSLNIEQVYYASDQVAPSWLRYKHDINPNAYMYSIDLAGYGTSQLPMDTNKLCLLGGFSDKILQFVPLFESDKTAAMEKIKSVTPETYRKHSRKDESSD